MEQKKRVAEPSFLTTVVRPIRDTLPGLQLLPLASRITKSSYPAGPLVRLGPALKTTSPAYLLQILLLFLPLLLPLLQLLLIPQLLSLAVPL